MRKFTVEPFNLSWTGEAPTDFSVSGAYIRPPIDDTERYSDWKRTCHKWNVFFHRQNKVVTLDFYTGVKITDSSGNPKLVLNEAVTMIVEEYFYYIDGIHEGESNDTLHLLEENTRKLLGLFSEGELEALYNELLDQEMME